MDTTKAISGRAIAKATLKIADACSIGSRIKTINVNSQSFIYSSIAPNQSDAGSDIYFKNSTVQVKNNKSIQKHVDFKKTDHVAIDLMKEGMPSSMPIQPKSPKTVKSPPRNSPVDYVIIKDTKKVPEHTKVVVEITNSDKIKVEDQTAEQSRLHKKKPSYSSHENLLQSSMNENNLLHSFDAIEEDVSDVKKEDVAQTVSDVKIPYQLNVKAGHKSTANQPLKMHTQKLKSDGRKVRKFFNNCFIGKFKSKRSKSNYIRKK